MVIDVRISEMQKELSIYEGPVLAHIEHSFQPINIFIQGLSDDKDTVLLRVQRVMFLKVNYKHDDKTLEFHIDGYIVLDEIGLLFFLINQFDCFIDGIPNPNYYINNLKSMEGYEIFIAVDRIEDDM